MSRPAPEFVPWIIPNPGAFPRSEDAIPRQFAGLHTKAAALTHDVVEAPPFVLFFNPTDDLRFYNYGVPVEAVSRLQDGELASLRAVFAAHNRLLRFEFIEEAAPDLASAFAAAGLAEEGRNPLLVCTPDSLRPAAEVPGLAIRRLTPESPRGRPGRVHQRARAELRRRRSGRTHRCTGGRSAPAFRAGEPLLPRPAGRLSRSLRARTPRRLTASPSWWGSRRWRITGAAASPVRSPRRMAQAAFRAGVRVAFLSAADERAGRVYERVGFQPYATVLAYCDTVTG